MKNLCAKTRPASDPYEVWQAGSASRARRDAHREANGGRVVGGSLTADDIQRYLDCHPAD